MALSWKAKKNPKKNYCAHTPSLKSYILIALSVCASVHLSRSRFWVSRSRRTDGQDLSVYFKWRCPRLILGSFFLLFFSRPFPAGCLGLIPGFFILFFFPPFSSGLPKVNTRVFFFRPFQAGCPRLIPGFFCFFFRPFPAGSLCMAEPASIYFKW